MMYPTSSLNNTTLCITAAVTSNPQLEMFKYTASSRRYENNNIKTSFATPAAVASHQLLQQIAKSEHAPGIRRAGCPCCDPDAASNYVDKMMMGGLT